MSENQKCNHMNVHRVMPTDGEMENKWVCNICGVQFFCFDQFAPGKLEICEPLLTIRDKFAMAALSGLLSNPPGIYDRSNSWIAEWCYKMADEMLKARQ